MHYRSLRGFRLVSREILLSLESDHETRNLNVSSIHDNDSDQKSRQRTSECKREREREQEIEDRPETRSTIRANTSTRYIDSLVLTGKIQHAAVRAYWHKNKEKNRQANEEEEATKWETPHKKNINCLVLHCCNYQQRPSSSKPFFRVFSSTTSTTPRTLCKRHEHNITFRIAYTCSRYRYNTFSPAIDTFISPLSPDDFLRVSPSSFL